MKIIIRSAVALLFLLVMAAPSLAQNPNLAIRLGPPPTPKACFPVQIKNLRSTPLNCTVALVSIFDQSTCKLVCEMKMAVSKTLPPCQTFNFTICCPKPLPQTWIARVRVDHSFGMNEEWLFRP